MKDADLILGMEWDKTFDRSDRVFHRKITFHNRYGITLAADMYTPKEGNAPMPAIAVCGPFGAAHTDLYDKVDVIPFDAIEEFIRKAVG